MKKRSSGCRWRWAIGALVVAAAAVAEAQQSGQEVRVRRVNHNMVTTPAISMRVTPQEPSSRGAAKRWAQIETQFDSQPEWLDELEFTYYVLLRPQDPREPHTLLTEKITYVHIPRGRQHYSWLYIHPHVLDRIGAVDGVAVEIRSRGRPIAAEASSPQHLQQYQQWISQLPAQSGSLLKPADTPFSLYAPDLQQMIKQP